MHTRLVVAILLPGRFLVIFLQVDNIHELVTLDHLPLLRAQVRLSVGFRVKIELYQSESDENTRGENTLLSRTPDLRVRKRV